MRTRALGLSGLVSLSLIARVRAGTSDAHAGATTTPGAATATPGRRPRRRRAVTDLRQAPSLKIGVVTDVGTVDDKNFNQYSYEGAMAGATDIGAADAEVRGPEQLHRLRPRHQQLRHAGLQRHRDGRLQPRPTTRSRPPRPTPTSGSSGSTRRRSASPPRAIPTRPRLRRARATPATLLPKFIAIHYEEDQAGYLAGIVAAGVCQGRQDRRHRRHQPGARRRALHPGLRAGRQVGQPEHPGRHRLRHHRATSTRPSTTRAPGRPSHQQFIAARRATTSCSRSPARPATASSRPPAPRRSSASAWTSTSTSR